MAWVGCMAQYGGGLSRQHEGRWQYPTMSDVTLTSSQPSVLLRLDNQTMTYDLH